MPLGESCFNCDKKLAKLPYYYCIGSKTHRCVECTEKQNEASTNRLKRYATNENSILLLADRVVDKARIGRNIQPTSQQECKEHSFVCNGCTEQITNNPRYICLGCRRSPNFFHSEPVDFCEKCARKLASSDDQLKQEVLAKCSNDGHTAGHALLRVLYRVIDNKEY